uniref:Apple domain-containing protein n=1 Tax=Scleropages formosus TaxID=113540 RepID=A0A8C9V0G4_SCLFO
MVSSLCSSECEKELSKNVEFIGNDVLQIFSPDAVHCQLACTQHHLCQFFSFFQSDWIKDNRKFHCYLRKTQENKPTKINAENGVTSGYALRSCGKPGEPCWSVVYKDVVFNGSDYSTLFTDSYKNCQITCNKDLSCMFFTYHTEDYNIADQRYQCHMKHSRTLPVPPVINPVSDAVSGFSQRPCQDTQSAGKCCTPVFHVRVDFPGNDFEMLKAPSAKYCQLLCTAHPRCTFFTFNSYVKESFGLNVCLYQASSIFFTFLTGCIQERFENIDFNGYDLHSLRLDDVQQCEDTCTADPFCQFYTYAYKSIANPYYRQLCHLKRVMTIPMPIIVGPMLGTVSGFHERGCSSGGVDRG